MKQYNACYTPIPSGYMGQLLDWPEVVTEGATLQECTELLQDALNDRTVILIFWSSKK